MVALFIVKLIMFLRKKSLFFVVCNVHFRTQTELVTRCRENINLLDAALAEGLSTTLQRDVRGKSTNTTSFV